jgi:hypothetical protein
MYTGADVSLQCILQVWLDPSVHSPTPSRRMSGGYGSEQLEVMVVIQRLMASVLTRPCFSVLRILTIVGL